MQGTKKKVVIYGMTNVDQFPKTHLHLRNVLYDQECCFHLLNDVFFILVLLNDAAWTAKVTTHCKLAR